MKKMTYLLPAPRTCSECGSSIPHDARDGYCPKCLLGLARTAIAGDDITSDPPAASPSCSTFGNYEVIELIGEGGMGVVYKASQKNLNRIVALKMIRSGSLASESEVRRFRSEAQAAAKLQHPSVVAIHEVGEQDGRLFFSMDYIEGQSLAQLVEDAPLAPNLAARYVRTIAEAVHYAHRCGILHRDLKPANILIDVKGQPRITDFGLAKQMEIDSDLTVSGAILGTPSYMPPEQASGKGKEIGPASDVYSLGAILYHLLTGRPPFRADTPLDILRQVVETDPASPRFLNSKVPRDLETICLKCMNKEPLRRYSTAQELADELGRFLNKAPIHARPLNWTERMWRWCRRNPVVASFCAVLALLLSLMTIAALYFRKDALDSSKASARYAAGAVRSELLPLAWTVHSVASSSVLPELIMHGNQAALTNFLAGRLTESQTNAPPWLALENWVLMTTNGVLVTRWPEQAQVLMNRVGRDYFKGAMARSDKTGIDAVYFSRVYWSVEDNFFKFGVSSPIRDSSGVLVGVVALMVKTISFTGALDPGVDRSKLSLVGAWDASSVLTPKGVPKKFLPMFGDALTELSTNLFTPNFALLLHPSFGTNNLVIPIDPPYGMSSGQSHLALWTGTYIDPVARVDKRFIGRWLASFSVVPDTHFIVVFQTRDRVADALVTAGGILILAMVTLAVCWFLRRRGRNHNPIPV